MRVLVCGDREWNQREYLFDVLDQIHLVTPISCIIEGGARGADTLAGDWAVENLVNLKIFPAQWDKYGRAAGPIRNTQMLVEGKPDRVVAFHENIDFSKGTKNMVNQAKHAKIPFDIYIGVPE